MAYFNETANSPFILKNYLFDRYTGEVTLDFKKQLDLIGIVSKQFFPEYEPNHIFNVNETLKTNGCFQRDYDYYKKGNKSNLKISYEQAKQYLDDDYLRKKTILPNPTSEIIDGVMLSGLDSNSLRGALHKRLNGLKESINARSLNFRRIYVWCNSKTIKTLSEEFIREHFKKEFDGIEFCYSTDDIEKSILKHYVLISDGTRNNVEFLHLQEVLKEHICLGIASVPIDWKEEMNLYGYETALGSLEKATIAFASSSWNFKAHQVETELRAYKITKAF